MKSCNHMVMKKQKRKHANEHQLNIPHYEFNQYKRKLESSPDHEETDPVLRQGLPGLDKVHLGLQQVQVLHVRVGLQDLLAQLNYGYYEAKDLKKA